MKTKTDGFFRKITAIFVFVMVAIVRLLTWSLCDRVASFIGLNAMRVRNKRLQIPIVFYTHQSTGKNLVFIGAIHMAPAGYFARLQRLLCDFSDQGYKIFYEGGPKEISEKGKNNRQYFVPEGWTEVADIRHQGNVMTHKRQWKDIDISYKKYRKMLLNRGFTIHKIGKNNTPQKSNFSRALVKRDINKFYKTLILEIIISRCLMPKILISERLKNEVVLDYRDQKIIHKVAKNSNKNITLLWGVGHLPGVEKGLLAMGYRKQKTEWVDAFIFEKYSFRDMLKDLNEEMKEKISQTFIMPYVSHMADKFESKNDKNER